MVNHWCHGAPGAIGPLLAASEFFLNESKQSVGEGADADKVAILKKLAC